MLKNHIPKSIIDKIRNSKSRLLISDFDGTLAPFSPDRDSVLIYKGLETTIKEVMESSYCQFVIISGRSVDNLKNILDLDEIPELWGSHGWERLKRDGSYYLWAADDKYLNGLELFHRFAEGNGISSCCEEKPRGIAVHWRGKKETVKNKIRRLVDFYKTEKDISGLLFHDFNGGIEIKIPGRTKADAVDTLLREASNNDVIAYLGDDITDEDAFLAINKGGISVLVRDAYRKTNAQYHIIPPDDLINFIKIWGKND